MLFGNDLFMLIKNQFSRAITKARHEIKGVTSNVGIAKLCTRFSNVRSWKFELVTEFLKPNVAFLCLVDVTWIGNIISINQASLWLPLERYTYD